MSHIKKHQILSNRIFREKKFSGLTVILIASMLIVNACEKKEARFFDVDKFTKESVPENGVHKMTIQGVITFTREVDDSLIKRVLEEVYLKYIKVDFEAVNEMGKYHGSVDPSSHVEVVKFVYGPDIQEEDDFIRFQQFCTDLSYYYKIKCDSMRIVDEDNRPFYYMSISDFFTVHTGKFEGADQLAGQNYVDQVMVDLFLFEKLGKYHLHKFVSF